MAVPHLARNDTGTQPPQVVVKPSATDAPTVEACRLAASCYPAYTCVQMLCCQILAPWLMSSSK